METFEDHSVEIKPYIDEAIAAYKERLKEKVKEAMTFLVNEQAEYRKRGDTNAAFGFGAEISAYRDVLTLIDQTT